MIWHRIGRTNPIEIADLPGGRVVVSRGLGDKWLARVEITIEAGNPEHAKARAEALVGRSGLGTEKPPA